MNVANRAEPPTASGAASTWSPAQLVRLESEWRRLRRGFAFHPHVRITPLGGVPPVEYRIEYQLRTLVVDATGQLAYVDSCIVHLTLPPQFPHASPVLRPDPACAVFHPNVTPQLIHLAPPWHAASGSLAEVVERCGKMLAYQFYDPVVVYNPAAMQWVAQFSHLVPTDPGASFSPDLAGGSAERIARAAADTLEQSRAQLAEKSLSILENGPGTSPAEVRSFGEQVSLSLSHFLEPDAPEHVRQQAADLDAWARSMTQTSSIWDELRDVHERTREAVSAVQRARGAQDALEGAIRAVEALGENLPAVEVSQDDPLRTVAALPGVAALDAAGIRLRSAVRDAEPAAGSLRGVVERLSGVAPPAPVGDAGSLLLERTTTHIARAIADADAARAAAAQSLAAIEPVLARARSEQAALDTLSAWARLADLIRRGNDMTDRLIELGAAGIQAYFIHTAADTYGPYQLEERIDLGGALLVVRRIGAAPLEVFDARSMALLGKAPAEVPVRIAAEDGSVTETRVRASEHTDELRVQLDYLIKTSRQQVEVVSRATSTTGAAPASWPGRYVAALATFEPTHAATETHRRAGHRWTALLADLDALGPFKERLATHHLLERHVEFVPAVHAVAERARASLNEASERLAFIAARSTRGPDDDGAGAGGSERLIVPPQFGQEYVDRLKQRGKAEKDLAKVRKLLALVAGELQARLANQVLQGRPDRPDLRLLEIMPEPQEGFDELLSDERLRSRVAELDRLLGTTLAQHVPAAEE